MRTRYKVGDKVKTVKGSTIEGSGEIVEIMVLTSDIQLLWGTSEPHYLIKDTQTNEFISVIERGLERI